MSWAHSAQCFTLHTHTTRQKGSNTKLTTVANNPGEIAPQLAAEVINHIAKFIKCIESASRCQMNKNCSVE